MNSLNPPGPNKDNVRFAPFTPEVFSEGSSCEVYQKAMSSLCPRSPPYWFVVEGLGSWYGVQSPTVENNTAAVCKPRLSWAHPDFDELCWTQIINRLKTLWFPEYPNQIHMIGKYNVSPKHGTYLPIQTSWMFSTVSRSYLAKVEERCTSRRERYNTNEGVTGKIYYPVEGINLPPQFTSHYAWP